MRVQGTKEYLRSLARHGNSSGTDIKQTQRLLGKGSSTKTVRNTGNTSADSLISKLNEKMSSTRQAAYSKIQTSASSLQLYGEKLASEDKTSLFSKAEASGKTKDVVTQVKAFVKEYNNMVGNMKKTDDTVNTYFAKELNSYAKENETKLKEMGITIETDGTLKMNESTLDKASLSSLKEVFQGTKSFAGKVAAKSILIEKKAVTELSNSAYSSNLSTYSSII